MASERDHTPIRQALVLAGGFGTRLGELTKSTPKPLLAVAGRPFIAYLIDWLARHGIDDIILSTGYLASSFDAFVTCNTWRDPYGKPVRVRAFAEGEPAGTAGAIKLHERQLDEQFLLVNGDSFFDCDLSRVLAAAQTLAEEEALLTVRDVPDSGRYGRVTLDGEHVSAFEEKSAAGRGLVNAGITVLHRDVVQRIETLPYSIERQIYPALAAEHKLRAIELSGYFVDIGLPETYAAAQTELPRALSKPALFLDRDGVLNPDTGYLHRIEDFSWMPGAVDGIARARAAGYRIVVVTNQAGVARGYYGEDAVERLHRHINADLLRRGSGAWIDAFYYCPYHPDGTVPHYARAHEDRKPAPGMLLKAARDLALDMSRSFMIGDKGLDIAAAEAAGIRGYLIGDGTIGDVLDRVAEA
ncbi:MAG: HAD-IIIA family hydrolase [Hyphomicrobiaceae bacterium]